MDDIVLDPIINSLLINNDTNKVITSYKLFAENDMSLIFDLVVLFSKSNKILTESFYKISFDYVFIYINKFQSNQLLDLFVIFKDVCNIYIKFLFVNVFINILEKSY